MAGLGLLLAVLGCLLGGLLGPYCPCPLTVFRVWLGALRGLRLDPRSLLVGVVVVLSWAVLILLSRLFFQFSGIDMAELSAHWATAGVGSPFYLSVLSYSRVERF